MDVHGAAGRTTKAEEAAATKALIEYLAAAAGAVPGHARVPLQPHRTVGAGGAGGRARRRPRLALQQLVETGLFVDLLPSCTQRAAGRGRVLRAEARSSGSPTTSAATRSTRARAQWSSTSGAWRRQRPGPPRRDRGVQRGRRARHAGAARLVGDATSGRLAVAAGGARRWTSPMPRTRRAASRRSMRSGPARVEHLMGDLLGYWRRERQVRHCGRASRCRSHRQADQFESTVGDHRGLTFRGLEPQFSAERQAGEVAVGSASRSRRSRSIPTSPTGLGRDRRADTSGSGCSAKVGDDRRRGRRARR